MARISIIYEQTRMKKAIIKVALLQRISIVSDKPIIVIYKHFDE